MKKFILPLLFLFSLTTTSFAGTDDSFVRCYNTGNGWTVDYIGMYAEKDRYNRTVVYTEVEYLDESMDVYKSYISQDKLYQSVRSKNIHLSGIGLKDAFPKHIAVDIIGKNAAIKGRGLNINGSFKCEWVEI
jgi:hypothetical protein